MRTRVILPFAAMVLAQPIPSVRRTWPVDRFPPFRPAARHADPRAGVAPFATERVRIDSMMRTLHRLGEFDGSILVARAGTIIYRNAFGEANAALHRPFTPTTESCLASVSKQFTAMAIMMLEERHRIAYDDPAVLYLPELSRYARAVTIRHLLNHTSGIPDVGDLGLDHPGLTNAEVLEALRTKDSLASAPGTTYRYSNTGYILLSLIIERVAGESYGTFLHNDILGPAGMNDTFLYDGSFDDNRRVAVGYNQFDKVQPYDDLTTGDGGMFSTVNDLLKWDQVLYSAKLVRQSTVASAFDPPALDNGGSSYGFGWNISEEDGQKVVWHTGSNGGYRAFIERRLTERVAIIMLTNRGNSKRQDIAHAIVEILHGRPYRLPKRSIAEAMYTEIKSGGLEAGTRLYNAMRRADTSSYDFSEPELNALGYELLAEHRPADAVQVFALNTASYPASSNAFDSLGEAYASSGDRSHAIQSYDKAIELDPHNLHALSMLKALQARP